MSTDLTAAQRATLERSDAKTSEASAPSVNPRGDGSDAGCDGNRTLFRKRPVVIEAVQFVGLDPDGVPYAPWPPDWRVETWRVDAEDERYPALLIPTLEGEMRASPGDWIIKGVKGEFYPCKPDIFAATYEPVPRTNASPARGGTFGREDAAPPTRLLKTLDAEARATLERLAAEATPGPWAVLGDEGVAADEPHACGWDSRMGPQGTWRTWATGPEVAHGKQALADARFIAACREAVPALLTSLRAAEAEVERLQVALGKERDRASAAEAERDALRKVVEDQRRELLARHDAMTEAEARSARDREALREALELIDDLMPYALQHWDWKYGDDWKAERAALASTEDRHDD